MDGLKQEKRSIFEVVPFSDEHVEALENCGDCSTCPLDGSSDDGSDFGCYRFVEIPTNIDCAQTRAEALRINQRVVELIEKGTCDRQPDTREQAAEKCISLIRTLVMMGDRFECEWMDNHIDVYNCRDDKVHEFPFE